MNMKIARFKSTVRRSLALPPTLTVQKSLPVKIEPMGGADRRLVFTISTEAVDRDNDVISLKGWDLKSFLGSPGVFFNHDTHGNEPSCYPVGRAVDTGVEGNALKSVVEFMPADMPAGAGERAEAVYRMVSEGFLSAASVGFRPLEWKTAKDRMEDDDWWPAVDFLKQELMEWSIVTIPANSEALVVNDERAAIVELQKHKQAEAEAAAAEQLASIARAKAITARRRELLLTAYG